MPEVSFILPAYKRRFLHEAIASILAQGYRDFELVVVDDCSPEDLKSVVDDFHDERLSYHRNETNIGGKDLVAAWNHALGYAKGEWVVLASDDDVYQEGFLDEMVALSKKYEKVNAIHCRINVIDRDGKEIEVAPLRKEFESGLEMLYNLACKFHRQVIADFMYRRSALLENGGFISRPMAWTADESIAIAMSRDFGAACSSKILFSWRLSGDNISSRYSDFKDKIVANEQYRKWVKSLLHGWPVTSAEERSLYGRCLKWIDRGVDSKSEFLLRNIGGVDWAKAVMFSPIPLSGKIRIFKRRVEGCLSSHPRIVKFLKEVHVG